MDKLRFKRFPYAIGELPTSYKMSMDYQEQLIWLCNYIEQTVIPKLDENSEAIEKFTELANQMEEKIKEIDEKLSELDTFKEEILVIVNNELNNQYNRVLSLMIDYQIIFNQELNRFNQELNERIDNIELGDVMAYDPTTGTYQNVSIVIQNVYDSLRANSITCTEFDNLELSATEYDNKEITAYNFDVNGRTFLLN